MDKIFQWFTRHWLDFFIIIYIFFIFYLTMVPFRFISSLTEISARAREIDWIPFYGAYRPVLKSDVFANIVFFIPFGFLLELKHKIVSNNRNNLFHWLVIMGLGGLVSLVVEILQLLTINRHTTTTDLISNVVGTLLGAVFISLTYTIFRKQLKKIYLLYFYRKPEITISFLIYAFILIYNSLPFIFQLVFDTIDTRIFGLSSGGSATVVIIKKLSLSFILYGLFSYFFSIGLIKYFIPRLKSYAHIFLFIPIYLLPVFLNYLQMKTPVQTSSLAEVFLITLGISYGILFFLIHGKIHLRVYRQQSLFEELMSFFNGTSFFYISFLFLKYIFPDMGTKQQLFQDLFQFNLSDPLRLAGSYRIDFIILFIKEVFAFLPSGFILSLFLYRKPKMDYSLWISITIFFLVFVVLIQHISQLSIYLFNVVAISTGLIAGWLCWGMFEILQRNRHI